MAHVAILTDSSANIPLEWIERYDIHILPLTIHWENVSYRDGIDITPITFYKRLSSSKCLPTTSQPCPRDFLQVFKSLEGQVDGILVLLLSSGISGTVESARAAARQISRVPVEIIDSRVTSTGLALVVLSAAQMASKGKSLPVICCEVEKVIQNLHVLFTVNSLDYLHRGGRISSASRILGTALQVKPILYFDTNGKLDALEYCRTNSRSLQRMIHLANDMTHGQALHLGILHANAPQIAQRFSEQVTEQLNCIDIFISELSPVIGAHVGPGTVGIAFYPENIS